MKRKNTSDTYEYPEWAEQIISEKNVKPRIRVYNLVSFEDDILQELTLRLYTVKKQGKDINEYYAYKVLRSILNDLHNKLARDRNKKNNMRRLKITEGNASQDKGPLAQTIDKDQFEQIVLFMDQLEKKDHMLLTLRTLNDYSFEKIAAALRYKNESGARVRYNKIIKQLRVRLNEKNK